MQNTEAVQGVGTITLESHLLHPLLSGCASQLHIATSLRGMDQCLTAEDRWDCRYHTISQTFTPPSTGSHLPYITSVCQLSQLTIQRTQATNYTLGITLLEVDTQKLSLDETELARSYVPLYIWVVVSTSR